MGEFKPQNFRIVAIDDNIVNRLLIKNLLKKTGYNHHIVEHGEELLSIIETHLPDLILMDLMMPNISGLELCKIIKSHPKFSEILIIFITASNEKEHLLEAFNLGAVDYVIKPFYHEELLARIKTHLELKQTRDELKQTRDELEKLATIDELTNIFNRRHFFSLAEKAFSFSRRKKRLFSVLLIDIDHFKRINDSYGHFIGDEALKIIVDLTKKSIRQEDLFARWGGEEFLILLSETSTDNAMIIAQRIRTEINNFSCDIEGIKIKFTVSIGVATYDFNDQNLDDIIKRADLALYEAKKTGRNKVVFREE